MRLFKLPIIISLLIHFIVLFSLAWIKLGTEYKDTKVIAVELLKQKQERLIKRPMPVHSKYVVYKFTDQQIPVKNIQRNRVDAPLILNNIDIQVSSYLENISYFNNELVSFTNNIKTTSIIHPEYTPLQRISPRTHLKSIPNSNGDKFIVEELPKFAKPDIKISFIQKDNKSLRKYLDIVRKRVEENKKYPSSAMNSNLEGRVGVRFAILTDGRLEYVNIAHSSGIEALDQSAIESIYDSAPFPSIPPDIDLDRIEVVVYIVFKISQLGKL